MASCCVTSYSKPRLGPASLWGKFLRLVSSQGRALGFSLFSARGPWQQTCTCPAEHLFPLHRQRPDSPVHKGDMCLRPWSAHSCYEKQWKAGEGKSCQYALFLTQPPPKKGRSFLHFWWKNILGLITASWKLTWFTFSTFHWSPQFFHSTWVLHRDRP